MNKKALGFFLGLVLLGGGRGSGLVKLKRGQPILLLGDSQSVAENPNSPGQLLAAKLTQAGYPCSVLAVGGKTAYFYSLTTKGRALLDEALALRPAVVVVFMGSNELANVALNPGTLGAQVRGHQKLEQLISEAGARALFVGPPDFAPGVTSEAGGGPLVSAAPRLVPPLRSAYGAQNFLDARPFTPVHRGVHFDADSAQVFARALFGALV